MLSNLLVIMLITRLLACVEPIKDFEFSIVNTDNGPALSVLAPFPLYFTPTGEPKTIKIDVNGIWYEVKWDGASLDLDHGPKVTSDNPPNEGPPNWFDYFRAYGDGDNGDNFFKGCGWMILIVGLISWLVWRML